MATLGIVGAGNVGGQLARRAIATGYDVVVTNSRDPERLAALVAELGDRARAGTLEEAARAVELVAISIR